MEFACCWFIVPVDKRYSLTAESPAPPLDIAIALSYIFLSLAICAEALTVLYVGLVRSACIERAPVCCTISSAIPFAIFVLLALTVNIPTAVPIAKPRALPIA